MPSMWLSVALQTGIGEYLFRGPSEKKGQVIDDGVREILFLFCLLSASITHTYYLTTSQLPHDIGCALLGCIHMSGVVSESARSDQQTLTTSRDGDTEYRGGRHYRIQDTFADHKPVTMDESNEPEVENAVTDISAVQKMLSAVSGSLLTSLLGMFPSVQIYY